jgi:hypothetical protein
MKRLSPDKRNKLLMAIVGSIGAVSLIYFFLISPQIIQNTKLKTTINTQNNQLELIQSTLRTAQTSAVAADENSSNLAATEADIASGDLYAWTYDTIRKFKAGYQVDIPAIGQPAPMENDLFASFPYKQIKFLLAGTGYYHDIGKFVAGLENKFPHMRVINLTLEPAGGPDATTDKLSFRMEVVALVRPTNT